MDSTITNLVDVVRLLAEAKLHSNELTLKDVVGPIIQLGAILVVCITLYVNLLVTRRLKRIDVTADFQKRYDGIMYESRKGLGSGETALDDFRLRFWSLQFDQFFSWRWGFIRDEVYAYWLKCRRDEREALFLRSGEGEKDTQAGTFLEGWVQARGTIPFPAVFVRAIDAVMESQEDVWEIMREAKASRRLMDKLLSWIFLEREPKEVNE